MFFSEIGPAIMLSYAVEDDKNVKFVKSKKMGIFQKGLTHGFGQKMKHFF